MKLKVGCDYKLTTQKTFPNKRYNINVIDFRNGFFIIRFLDEFGELVSTTYYRQKTVDDLINEGSWRIEPKSPKNELDDSLFRVE